MSSRKQPEKLPAPTLEGLRRELARRSLMDFVPWATPGYGPPLHLRAVVEPFERAARGEALRMCFCAPPQFGKSDTLTHGVAWSLWQDPALRFGYATYGDELVRDKSKLARRIVTERLGVELDSERLDQWDTPQGGGFIGTSVRGALTGKRCNFVIVDDPYKNRNEAESPATRRTVRDFMNDVVETRLTPDGSCFVFMARWHPEDLIGELARDGWDFTALPALDERTGASLWPERWSREALELKRERVGPFTWESLYQGRPRPRGASVFGAPTSYSELPKTFRVSMGLDLAYSARTSSDYSVVVVMLVDELGRHYVVDVRRVQTRAPAFVELMKQLRVRWPTARARWYVSTTERGLADLINPELTWLESPLASSGGDKFIRAQPVAAAWNAGRVLVPADGAKHPWLDEFVAELVSFTGTGDDHDDQVDALAAAFDVLAYPSWPEAEKTKGPPVSSPDFPAWNVQRQKAELDAALEEGMRRKRREREELEGDVDFAP